MSNKEHQARLHARNPKAGHFMSTYTAPDGRVYYANTWSDVSFQQAKQLATVRQIPGDEDSNLAFTLARDKEHALRIEVKERSAKRVKRGVAKGQALSFEQLREQVVRERMKLPEEDDLRHDGIFASEESINAATVERQLDAAEHSAAALAPITSSDDEMPGRTRRRRRRRRRRRKNATAPAEPDQTRSVDVDLPRPPPEESDEEAGIDDGDDGMIIRRDEQSQSKRDADATQKDLDRAWNAERENEPGVTNLPDGQ